VFPQVRQQVEVAIPRIDLKSDPSLRDGIEQQDPISQDAMHQVDRRLLDVNQVDGSPDGLLQSPGQAGGGIHQCWLLRVAE
jgi:hypothetical protein